MKYPSEEDDWKKIEKNHLNIAFNILQVKNEKIHPVYLSKHNSNPEKKIILLMILDSEGGVISH